MQKKYAENYSIIVSFLYQTYKFIRKRAMTGQKFRQWSDDIKPEDDITPFDGILQDYGLKFPICANFS